MAFWSRSELLVLYSTLHSLQVKNNWKCDSEDLLFSLVKNYFERKLVIHVLLHYLRKRFFRKGFDPEFILSRIVDLTRNGFLVFTHARVFCL